MRYFKQELAFSVIVTAIITLLFLDIAFLGYGQGILTEEYRQAYFPILLASTIILWVFLIIDFSKLISRDSPISFGFIAETNPLRLFSKSSLVTRSIPHLFISAIFVFSAIGLKTSWIPVTEAFNTETLSQVTEISKLKYRAVVPGFGEEAIIFGIVTISSFIIQRILTKKRGSKFVAWISWITGSAIGSLVFVLGHNQAYGLDAGAKLSAFMFEFIVQMANQSTGMFLSWLPHMLHNGVVVLFAYSIILSIGGTKI